MFVCGGADDGDGDGGKVIKGDGISSDYVLLIVTMVVMIVVVMIKVVVVVVILIILIVVVMVVVQELGGTGQYIHVLGNQQ